MYSLCDVPLQVCSRFSLLKLYWDTMRYWETRGCFLSQCYVYQMFHRFVCQYVVVEIVIVIWFHEALGIHFTSKNIARLMKQDNNISFNISITESNQICVIKEKMKHENVSQWSMKMLEKSYYIATIQSWLVCSYCAMSWNLIQIARLISRQMAWSH